MKKEFLDILRCLKCRNNSFHLEEIKRDDVEIRNGKVLCNSCNASYEIDSGILNFIRNPSLDVKSEQYAVDNEEYLWDDRGNRYRIDRYSIAKFKEQFLLLPKGDGSYFFRKGGCFESICKGSHRFYSSLKNMGMKTGIKVLSLGDGFGYASYRFAEYGCNVVALDISKYLFVSDIYVKDRYFERIFADMHDLPFRDKIFDIIFCSAVLHHSKKLIGVFSEIRRTLKPDGRMFAINESARGIFEKNNLLFEDLNKRGYSDTAYTIPEWINAGVSSGFNRVKVEFLSMSDDYIIRQENKDAKLSLILRIAYFLKRHRGFERILLFLLRYPRILFRPRSWRMVCCN